uniref:G_PROTEIN_RECEP_F1_2 domain-containing protein n=1 Tax=Brugia timori TaxID=42155 RepID=A0A0R3Q9E8_9BILA
LLYGTISNILMVTVCYSRDNHYSRPFILIVCQIIFSNLISFIPYLTVLLPEILLNKKYGNFKNKMDQPRILHNLCLFIFRHVTLFICVDAESLRSHSFTEIQCIFRIRKAVLLIPLRMVDSFRFIKFWAIFLSVTMLAMYSVIIRNIRHRFASINNETQIYCLFRIKYGNFKNFCNYSLIMGRIRWKLPHTNDKYGMNTLEITKYERSMLIQAALTSGGLIIGAISFGFLSNILIQIFDQKALLPINISHCSYILLYRCTLPTAFFLTNQRARKYLCSRLRNNVVKPIPRLTK